MHELNELLLFEVVVMSCVGLGMECAFTAAWRNIWKKRHAFLRRHLMGYSSLWYVPLYAPVPFICQAAEVTGMTEHFPWPWRGTVYMLVIYAFEYPAMRALQKILGTSPSEPDYRRKRAPHLHGCIRADFVLVWFCAGLLLERIHAMFHPVEMSVP